MIKTPLQEQEIFLLQTHAGVGQDKSEPLRDRPASDQPYRHEEEVRSNQEGVRSTPTNGQVKDSLVPLTTQIRRSVKAEIQRLAKKEHLSDSATAAAFLEQAVQGHIDMQYGAMLKPVIETTIERKIQSYSNRSAHLAVHAYYSAEQARILMLRVLSLLLDNVEELPELIAHSQKQSRENLKYSMGGEQEDKTLWQ